MLWVRYALLKAKPFTSMADIYSNHLESPGTKAYTKAEAEDPVRSAGFQTSSVTIQLNHGICSKDQSVSVIRARCFLWQKKSVGPEIC